MPCRRWARLSDGSSRSVPIERADSSLSVLPGEAGEGDDGGGEGRDKVATKVAAMAIATATAMAGQPKVRAKVRARLSDAVGDGAREAGVDGAGRPRRAGPGPGHGRTGLPRRPATPAMLVTLSPFQRWHRHWPGPPARSRRSATPARHRLRRGSSR